MAGKKFDFAKQMANDRSNLIATGLITALEVLKDYNCYNQDQLNAFSDKYMEKLSEKLKEKPG